MELSIRDWRVKLVVLLAGMIAAYLLRSTLLLTLLLTLYALTHVFARGEEYG